MKKKILYYDYLRVISILAVIIIHVSAEYWYNFNGSLNWYMNNFINGMVGAWPVPLFVTISGSLLLGNKKFTIKNMAFKYLPRILICLVFWHYFYYFYSNRSISIMNFVDCTKALFIGNTFSHLWYLYLLIGLYLLTPILSKLAESLNKKEYLYLLLLGFFISVAIPWTSNLISYDFTKFILPFEVLDFNRFIFYYMLGYYLKKYVNINGNRYCLISFGLLMLVSLYSNYAAYSNQMSVSYCGTNSIVSIFIVISLFSFFKKKYNVDTKPFISLLGDLSFGVYLVHFFIEKILFKCDLDAYFINPILGNVLTSLIILILSYAISYIISKIPYIKKIIGL